MITVDIIADSLNPNGDRLTTFVLEYPRIILAELNTHRMLSRSSASSRAIPFPKLLRKALWNTFYPVHWGQNQSGMQAKKQIPKYKQVLAKWIWWGSAVSAVSFAWTLNKLGIHKQVVNRVLEPYIYVKTILSATDLENFFNLRVHKDAQPEIQELARQMLIAYKNSIPKQLQAGEWHKPFGDKYLDKNLSEEDVLKVCAARCARVSYENFDGKVNYEKDFALCTQLIQAPHASPFEHVAQALETSDRVGNFKGFKQYRKCIPNENQIQLDIERLLDETS